MIRRALTCFVLCAALAGCTSASNPNLAAFSALVKGDLPPNPVAVARFEQLKAAGAPMLLAGVKNRDQAAVAALMLERGPRTTWVTSDDVSLSFEGGMLVATRGLGFDLMSADIAQSRQLIMARQSGVADRFHSYLGGENQTMIRSFVCQIDSRGARDVQIGPEVRATWLMAERCDGAGRFTNLYWLDALSGAIVQSRQWVSADTGAVELREMPR